ncbi:MAG: type II toxin-antitoxin system Phd/YefM family antitoxin [Desulfobacterales bacterium]|nr:type II toxin-antitoxin system Phd/YefM family antitoxin [Desulfobacterales bacterium]
MKLSESVKSISYLKAHASELIREVSENKKSLIITQNGEAKAIVQDLESYEQMKDSLTLLKILAQSSKSKIDGKFKPAKKSFQDLRSRTKELE